MKKEIYIPILVVLGIAVAELATYFGDILSGLGIYIIDLLVIMSIIIFSNLGIEIKNVLQSLILVILLRVVSLSIPQFFATTILQYPLIYGVMFIPIYYVVKSQQISSKELGIDFRKLHMYIPISIFIGAVMAIIEYKILSPVSLIKDIRISNIILITIVMFVFVGLVEEVIFRSIIQTRIEKISGPNYGILLSGGLFGIMHASYGIISGVIFAAIFGIILSYIFQKTRNLPFIVSIHGVANIMTFGILSKILFMV